MPEDVKFVSRQDELSNRQEELSNMIALYESYLTNIESNMISEREMNEKGESFLQWVNDLLGSKIKKINQITEHSIEIFKQLSIQEKQIQTRIAQLQHESAQKNTTIQNHQYTIKSMDSKLTQRENDIYKLKNEISQLTEKIDKQESKFKKEAKEFKKTFRIIQQNTESDKQIFDSIQLQYEYERHQKDQLKSIFLPQLIDELQLIQDEFTVVKKELDETKRLLKASENKLEWEMKKKYALEDVVKEKNQMIEKLLVEIHDLKYMLKDPYNGIDEEHMNERDSEDIHSYQVKSLDKNLLSQEIAFRQSFSSEIDMDDDYMRRNSMRKRSFDDGSVQPSEGNLDYVINQEHDNEHLGVKHRKDKYKSNKSSFYHEQNNPVKDQTRPKVHSNEKIIVHSNEKIVVHSPTSVVIKDMQKSPSLPSDSSATENSQRQQKVPLSAQIHRLEPQNNINQQKQDELQIITQKVQSESQPMDSFRRYVPDLYFAHFLLTSQSVKIKEDCQQMLNIDVKQYYQETIQKRIPMHIWDEWIRDKLRNAVKAIHSKYDEERRSSRVSVKK